MGIRIPDFRFRIGMFSSCEIKWFFEGSVPQQVRDWYLAGGHEPDRQTPRTDHYLHLPNNDGLGVKLREGRIEIKQRFGLRRGVQPVEKVNGLMEHWRKWSFPVQEDSFMPDVSYIDENWLAVRKARMLKIFHISENGEFLAGKAGEGYERACGWELTELSLEGKEQKHWTLGLEAFGSEEQLSDTLLKVAEFIFQSKNTPELTSENSYGYPKWLLKRFADC